MEKFSAKHRENLREAARKRWEGMGEGEVEEIKESVSLGMKIYWAKKSKEERRVIALKAAATRRANILLRKEGK